MNRASSIFLSLLVPCAAIAAVSSACGDDTSTGSGGDASTQSVTHATVSGSNATSGTMSTSSTTTTTSGVGSSTSSGMLSCPSGSYTNIPQSADCDLFLQNCADGTKCVTIDDGTPEHGSTTGCQGNQGLKQPGEACQQDFECSEGLLCVGQLCSAVCCPDNMQPCNGGSCSINVTIQDPDGNPTDDFFWICSYAAECTLFQANACSAGLDCHPEPDQPGLATCVSPTGDNIPEGGVCDALNDCATMQTCVAVGGEADSHCYALCEQGNTMPPGLGGCLGTQTCELFDFGFPGVGLCIDN